MQTKKKANLQKTHKTATRTKKLEKEKKKQLNPFVYNTPTAFRFCLTKSFEMERKILFIISVFKAVVTCLKSGDDKFTLFFSNMSLNFPSKNSNTSSSFVGSLPSGQSRKILFTGTFGNFSKNKSYLLKKIK